MSRAASRRTQPSTNCGHVHVDSARQSPSSRNVIISCVLPNGWQACDSSAIEAFRFHANENVLQLVFLERRVVYDYPCTEVMYDRFQRASSKGQFVNDVLKPYAEQHGWSAQPYDWRPG